MPKARHPKAERFVREELFKHLNDFSEFVHNYTFELFSEL